MHSPSRLLTTLALAAALSACGGKNDGRTVSEVAIDPDAARTAHEAALAEYPKARLRTDAGDIVIALHVDKAPETVRNFRAYAESGHYDGTVFHRVAGDLLIQGGAYTADYRIKPERGFIRSESDNGLRNLRGTVAAARRGNDADSAGAQFFINVVDNPQFDFVSAADAASRGYTVFGEVVEGMAVVDALRKVPVASRPGIGAQVPKAPIVIRRVTVED
jgi:cyclophilin family peptidyl-prolyl cis-trans isomerase